MTPEALAQLAPYEGPFPLWEGAKAHRFAPGVFAQVVEDLGHGVFAMGPLWPPGPWNEEPDRIEWRHAGQPCLMVRANLLGHWCGYVGVSRAHPWHGRHFDDVGDDVAVHGGLTFSDGCGGLICHVPEPGEDDDVHWFGFDCAHPFDGAPAMGLVAPLLETYRDVAYVRGEVEQLAEQARGAAVAS